MWQEKIIFEWKEFIPAVHLLYEPTSNLDSLNEAVILKSIRDYCKDKTVVLVSHRQSTMSIANETYSVENGRIS